MSVTRNIFERNIRQWTLWNCLMHLIQYVFNAFAILILSNYLGYYRGAIYQTFIKYLSMNCLVNEITAHYIIRSYWFIGIHVHQWNNVFVLINNWFFFLNNQYMCKFFGPFQLVPIPKWVNDYFEVGIEWEVYVYFSNHPSTCLHRNESFGNILMIRINTVTCLVS